VHTKHHDTGSLVTVDLLLADCFEGGEFQTLERGGELRSWAFERGDANVFVSHKYHCVAPLQSGQRQVLIAELWEGPERTCAHRCVDPGAVPCPHTLSKSQREAMQLRRVMR